ncbi:MAG TPA: alpha/beta hydrolase [Chloroflexota bacterium]
MPVSGMAPLIPVAQAYAVQVDDVEYARPPGGPLLARIYRPVGVTPTAAVVDVHGGAWVVGDRTQHQALDQALAANGVLVAAVDFRQPPGNPYPTSLIDVNLAIRWLKHHLAAFGARADTPVGASGGSSGGHVVILCAMRPRDARYAVVPLADDDDAADASLAFVITDAPVTDPQARYLRAVREGQANVVERHRMYWSTDSDAIEGNPNLILARGERVALPPLLITQGTQDQSVPLAMTREFVDRYARAGGEVQLHTFDGLGHGFILQEPARAESVQQAEMAIAFIRAHSGA